MKFLAPGSYTNEVKLELTQSRDCVHLAFNQILVAYFSGDEGELTRVNLSDSDVELLKQFGVAFDSDKIKVF